MEKECYRGTAADLVTMEPDLVKVKDRVAVATGIEFIELGNQYRDLWTNKSIDEDWEIDIRPNFDAETEEYMAVKYRDYPTYISVLNYPEQEGFCQAMTSDPMVKAVCIHKHQAGDEIPPFHNELRKDELALGFFGIDSEDLEGVAAWIRDRFDVPLERFDSPSWGPYYTLFDPAPEDVWIGHWTLWFNINPIYNRPGEWGHLDWPLLLRIGTPQDYAGVRQALLEEAPFDTGIIEERRGKHRS